MGSLQPARCSQACHILFLLCLFPVTVQHLTSSQWPHLPSLGRGKKKDLRGRVSVCLPLMILIKTSREQPEEWKTQMSQGQDGYEQIWQLTFLAWESYFKIWVMYTTAGLGKHYIVYWHEGCILYEAAESTRGVCARSKPSAHTCVHWPVYWRAGWIAGSLRSSVPQQMLGNGLYQESVLLKPTLQVWATEWLWPRHSASPICDGSCFLVGKFSMSCRSSDFSVHSHCPQPRVPAMEHQPGWQNWIQHTAPC